MSVTFIIGDAGSGKTRLAGTWPDSLWLNGEGSGSDTALAGQRKPNRINILVSRNAIKELEKHLSQISTLKPDKDGFYEYEGHKFRTVVIDSFDAFQDVAKMVILNGRTTMEQRDWGALETMMRGCLLYMGAMLIPVAVIAHVKITERGEARYGVKTWSAQGSITQRMSRVADEILHVVVNPANGQRYVAIQADTLLNDYTLLAKDRHERLKHLANDKGFIAIHSADGYPPATIAGAIYGEGYGTGSDTE
jgi:hypothetical protein